MKPTSIQTSGGATNQGKPLVLVLPVLGDEHLALIERNYRIIYAPKPDSVQAQLAAADPDVRAVLTSGTIGLAAEAIAAMPRLELICALGVGYENIDVSAARARGIVLANGAGVNADSVADHAMGLLLATVRGIVTLDAQVRQGLWRDDLPLPADVSGRRLGLLGLGDIGHKIARRAQAFNLEIGYCTRNARTDVPYLYHASALELARWCDFLIVITPGGPSTRHLVNAPIIEAIGPQGVLVNVARGSVVDTAALAEALRHGRLGGAGLDVYESEPLRPELLMGLPGVVLTPHVGGSSPQAVRNSVDRFLANADGHFAGRGPDSPI
ncbi:2-hydroxyacid dehydrogenase [Pusillimonas sp.]|uniref:2-hydroxyacid dehydrogenase n=1 Tax=Pusillimonas sp. TaxID=3040095 RepID=UPI0037C77CFC